MSSINSIRYIVRARAISSQTGCVRADTLFASITLYLINTLARFIAISALARTQWEGGRKDINFRRYRTKRRGVQTRVCGVFKSRLNPAIVCDRPSARIMRTPV